MSDLDKKYTICLDLINNIQNEKMRFSLSDNETSDFYINITKSMKKVDLTYKTVKLYVVKPNKNVIYTTVTPYTECNDTNVFYCDLPNNFKNIKGTYYAQMLVEDIITGEKVVAPSKFSYIVESDIMSEMYEVADTEENKNILDSILSDLADLKANKIAINDTTASATTTYSSNKIERIKEDINSRISAIGGSGGSSGGMTSEQTQQLSAAYEHSQSTHAPSNAEANVQSDWNVIDRNSDAYIANKPTNVSEFANDANYTTKTYVDDAIADIEITGGSNINDTTASETTTYSSNKIETIKRELNSQVEEIAHYSLVKHTDGKIYIKKQDGALVGTGVEVVGNTDLSKVTMSMDGQTLKLLNDGTQIATVEIPTATVTDEQLTAIIQSKIDDGTLSGLTIADGSIGIDKTTLVNKTHKNVYDLEKVTTDSNYLAIRNVKANTKYYVRATWSKTLYPPNTIYSLNESTNSKQSVGTLTKETIDDVSYYTFTLTSNYDLIGLFRTDGNPSVHVQYCTLGVYGFEAPFILETYDTGINESWQKPLVKYLVPTIVTNVLNKFGKDDNSTDKIITPNKTDFVEMTTTKSVGCYNYADVLFDTILGNYTYDVPDTSKSEKELQYRWYKASYTTWATKLGIPGNGYGIFLLPLTPGTWYIRRLVRSVHSPNTNFSIIGFANPDIATNPTTILSDSGIEITNYQKFNYVDSDGVQHNDEYIDFGAWDYINNSGNYIESTVCLHKVVIPDGVYGFITGSPTSPGSQFYPTGHNELYTIMDYNPIDDILQIVEDSFQRETLKPANKYEKGFIANLANSESFSNVIKNNIDTFIPQKYAKHTIGKSLIIFGDSLTQYAGGDGKTGDGFLTLANRYLGMNMTQSGYAGSNWSGSNTGDCPAKVNKLISDRIDYDVILLAWGTNPDDSNGAISDTPSSTGSMVSVMKWAIEEIRYNYPMAGIGVIVPPPSLSFSEDKANLMIDVCRSEGIPYLDMYHEGGISINYNKNGGLSADQIHLHNIYGSNRYSTALVSFIERICPCVTYYKITKNLTNIHTSSTYKYLFDVSRYEIVLTADDGYTIDTVTVTMGGVDVTSSTYANGKVTINGCTGDIVITASAIQTA